MGWTVPRFDYLVTFSGASHVGNVRKSNDDAWLAEPSLGFFAVADAMSGSANAALAAQLGVEHPLEWLRRPEAQRVLDEHLAAPTLETRAEVFKLLAAAVRSADALVRSRSEGRHPGLGCTLDLLLLVGSHAFLVHVGDSRAYLLRPTTTIQLTSDHTVRESLLSHGVGTPSQPPQASEALVNVVGRRGGLAIDEIFLELSPGDRIVLCTDGVHEELHGEPPLSELARRGRVEDCAVTIINAVLAGAARDNATTLLIEVGRQRVLRDKSDGGLAARDFTYARHSPLLTGLGDQLAAEALQSAIELQFRAGTHIPRVDAGDRVGYIVLEGAVVTPQGWTLGPSALLYPESLAGGGRGQSVCKALQDTRVYRIRAEDLRQVCAADPELAAAVYERLARNLARMLG